MIVNVDIDNYMKVGMDISFNSYVMLQMIYQKEKDYPYLVDVGELKSLEAKGWIKIIDNELHPRQRLIDLFKLNDKSVTFEIFWKKYCEISGKPKTDKAPAEKKWKRLTNKEKNLAVDNIQAFVDHTINTMGARYIKKARTYLEDKNFNDEFENVISSGKSINTMV